MIARRLEPAEWLRRNLVHSDGIWRGMSLNDKGELVLSTDGLQYHGEFWFTVCFTNTIEARCSSANRVLLRFRGCDVTQDADLEYDPADWAQMLPLIIARKVADVVYGSRFYGRPHRSLYFHHYIGNRLISF